jgi:predicted regulator of Ras-like GTPase activity (Roadblock/LC7/MglB family)
MLEAVVIATHLPTWRCPTVLFMLPPSSLAIADKIRAIDWPPKLQLQIINEKLDSTSAVWNALLSAWNRARMYPQWESTALQSPDGLDFPIKIADFGHAAERQAPTPQVSGAAPSSTALDADRASAALCAMLQVDGLIGCAVARNDGTVLARHLREGDVVDLDSASAACALVLSTLREKGRDMSLSAALDEVTISAGPRLQVLRTLPRQPGYFIFAVLDRERSNLGMVRLKMAEAEKALF